MEVGVKRRGVRGKKRIIGQDCVVVVVLRFDLDHYKWYRI